MKHIIYYLVFLALTLFCCSKEEESNRNAIVNPIPIDVWTILYVESGSQ